MASALVVAFAFVSLSFLCMLVAHYLSPVVRVKMKHLIPFRT